MRLVDIRSKLEVKIEGVPLVPESRKQLAIHAPYAEVFNKRHVTRQAFVDDVVFSPGVKEDTTFVVMDTLGGVDSRRAAEAIASVGTRHDIYIIAGGFRAWEAAGLDHEPMADSDGEGSSVDYYGSYHDMAWTNAPKREPLSNDQMVQMDYNPGWSLPFRPKIFEVLAKGYTAADLQRDVMAGLTVGIIALALGMALGIASESTPAIGLYTVVIGGFLTSAMGGSSVAVGGPTAAFIPIVAGVAHNYGASGLVVCTGMAGAMLVAMGATGLGGIIRYVPKPVVAGFTAGIATYIFSTQVKDLLGLGLPGRLPEGVPIPAEFLEKVVYLGNHLDATHWPSLALGLSCLALIKGWPKNWAKVVPAPIAAITAGTIGLLALGHFQPGVDQGIETIGSHFGADAIPRSLPMPQWPSGFSLNDVSNLVYPAATIAVLAAIESLLCARVADTMLENGDKHDSNTELISQGAANIACAAFGCLPATGALARTAANIRAGGRSPVSGMVHAVVVLGIILAAAPAATYIPLPALSAVLLVVALNMGEWHHFFELPKWPSNDAQLFLVAYFLTVFQDVAVAVALGMVVALATFVQDVSGTMYVKALPPRAIINDDEVVELEELAAELDLNEEDVEGHSPARRSLLSSSGTAQLVPAATAYVEVTGSLLFGAGSVLEKAIERMHSSEPVKVIVLNMAHVSVVDVSGLEVLEEQVKRLHSAHKHLVLCGLSRQPLRMMARAGFLDEVGRDNVCRTREAALKRAAALAGGTARDSSMPGTSGPVETVLVNAVSKSNVVLGSMSLMSEEEMHHPMPVPDSAASVGGGSMWGEGVMCHDREQ